MNRPRVSLGLEATRATLNRAVCVQVGQDLSKSRQEKGLAIAAVGKSLLLSSAQVSALETANPDTFYSAEFYTVALRKYAALLGTACEGLESALVSPERPDIPRPSAKDCEPLSEALPKPAPAQAPRRRRLAVLLAAPALALALVGVPVISAVRTQAGRVTLPLVEAPPDIIPVQAPPVGLEISAEPPPTATELALAPMEAVATVSEHTAAPPPVVEAPPVRPQDAPTAFGRVRVDRSTWIFVRYTNNSTTERGLPAGGEFVLQDRPVYLAVGAVEGTNIELGGRILAAADFASNGQIRIGASSLTSLLRITP